VPCRPEPSSDRTVPTTAVCSSNIELSDPHSNGQRVPYPPSFLGLKRPGREVDQSPPFSAEFKNEWSCTFAPPLLLRGGHRDDFTFLRLDTFEAIVFVSQLVTVLYADSAVPSATGTFCCLNDFNSWNPQVAPVLCVQLPDCTVSQQTTI
jgi:hypothetical protein